MKRGVAMIGITTLGSLILLNQIVITIKNWRSYVDGGEVLKSFGHNSSIKKVVSLIIVFAIIFTVWSWRHFGLIAISNVPILFYLILVQYSHSRKIEVLEKGIFVSGRFIKWDLISKVEGDSNGSLKVSLIGEKYKVYVVDQVDQMEYLLEITDKVISN